MTDRRDFGILQEGDAPVRAKKGVKNQKQRKLTPLTLQLYDARI